VNNGRNARANGRQEHCDQCQRDSNNDVWKVTRRLVSSGMCSISIVWRKGDGDDLSARADA
jgi:hypothetical protein